MNMHSPLAGIRNLILKGFYSEEEALMIDRFILSPKSFSLPRPQLQILADFLLVGTPLEQMEKNHGWCARSGKQILKLLLQTLIAIERDAGKPFEGLKMPDKPDPHSGATDAEILDYIRAEEGDQEVLFFMRLYKLTQTEARMLLALKRSPGMYSTKESLLLKVYSGRTDDPPEIKILDVMLSRIRSKVPSTDYEIETLHALGLRLKVHNERTPNDGQP